MHTFQIDGFEQKYKDTFELIRRHRTISKQQLLDLTTLSPSTLTRTLEELSERALIHDAGLGDSTGGRRPILYQINPKCGHVFGLEISRTFSKLTLFDMKLDTLDTKKWHMDEEMTPDVLVQEIAITITYMLQRLHISRKSVIGMGIGAVGPLDRTSGMITEPMYFPAIGWSQVSICQMIESVVKFPVFLDNGSNMAILGEYWATRNQAYQHLLYVHVGVGIRSAMMSSGKLVYGAVDMEGSIGQMIIQADGSRINQKNNYGALENYASIYAIEQHAMNKLRAGRDSILKQGVEFHLNSERIPFAQLIQAYRSQDPLTIELFTEAATFFGIGLANLLNILHPEKVILGGPLMNFDPLYFNISTQVALQKTYYYPTYQVEFSLGNLGEDAVVTGAAEMVVQRILSN